MGRAALAPLIAIEGIDGAGKNTLTAALRAHWRSAGLSVGHIAFPRYGTAAADIAAAALHGEAGDLAESVYGMAALFALDRQGAQPEIEELRLEHDLLLVDRWTASNAAYSLARMGQTLGPGTKGAATVAHWLDRLEHATLGSPPATLTVYLEVPTELARAQALGRERQDDSRRRDRYERDASLQEHTGRAYGQLADAGWGGPWVRVPPHPRATDVAALIAQRLQG